MYLAFATLFRFESDYTDPTSLLVPEPHLHFIHPLRRAFCCIGAPRTNHRGRACLETRLYQCCYADVFSTYAINSWIVSYSLLASSFQLPTVFSTGCTHNSNQYGEGLHLREFTHLIYNFMFSTLHFSPSA
jgi:hypothetical protein